MKRAEETFARLKEIESSMEERVAALPTDSADTETTTSSTNNLLMLGIGALIGLGIVGLAIFYKKSKAES